MRHAVLAFATVASACLAGAEPSAAQQFFRVGAGLGGTYQIYGAKLAELVNKNIPGVHASTMTGGGEQNLVKIQRGEAEISIIYTFNAYQVYTGKGELKVAAPDLRHVMSLYGSYHTPMVHKDSPLKSLADVLKYKSRVWMGSRASVFWALNEAALNAHGVTLEAIPKAGGIIDTMAFANQNQAFQDRKIDVGFYSGPAPYGLMLELDRNPGFRILNFDDDAAKRYVELLPGAGMGIVKGGTYQSMPEDVRVPYVFNQMVSGTKVPEDLVYKVTKLMNEHAKDFHGLFPGSEEIQTKTALDYNKLPIHPGAERYYREIGLMR
jgi:TRAP transporter TAXI family solute receptor